MVMALICLTFRSPNTDIVLVMEGEGLNAPSGYHFVTARDIAIGAELDDFPITEADGVIQALCKFGMEAQEQHIAQRWSVAARRAHYEWEVFHATRAEGGINLIVETLFWGDEALYTRAEQIEDEMPYFWDDLEESEPEHRDGVRTSLGDALRELADIYGALGDGDGVAFARAELSALDPS